MLAISQVFPPDPTSLGQHLADATAELAGRGNSVIVFTADSGYNDPDRHFPRREFLRGVDIRRIRFSSFGKRNLLYRIAGGISFLIQAVGRGLFVGRVGTVLVSTSPPFAGVAGLLLAKLKRARLVYWVMDVNPDQAVALGVVAPGSWAVRSFDWLNRMVLGQADAVVTMDRYMADRLEAKRKLGNRLHVIAPWPHEEQVTPVPREGNPFRREHRLDDKFVVMYSGNLTVANPLRTVIDAAIALRDDPRFVFVFIGDGTARAEIESAEAANILMLPYQRLEDLKHSLGAADLHVVTMGDDMLGIAHTSKVYGICAAARPLVFIGPAQSHVADLLARDCLGWQSPHGDVQGLVGVIRGAAEAGRGELAAMGTRAYSLVRAEFSKETLCARFCDVVDPGGRAR